MRNLRVALCDCHCLLACHLSTQQHMLHCVLQAMVVQKDPKDAKAIHILSSGIKAAATWGRVEILQHCRECCGGQGFLAANKIG